METIVYEVCAAETHEFAGIFSSFENANKAIEWLNLYTNGMLFYTRARSVDVINGRFLFNHDLNKDTEDIRDLKIF